jgi:hypothetical protein
MGNALHLVLSDAGKMHGPNLQALKVKEAKMFTAKRLIISSFIGAAALLGVLGWTTYMPQANNGNEIEGIQVVYEARENDEGVCTPYRVARANKEDLGIDAVYGQSAFVDQRDGKRTSIPLQIVFTGWDDQGMSRDEVQTAINTNTPCAELKIEHVVKECLHSETRPTPTACPPIEVRGEGFAAIELLEDQSQQLDQP